MHVELQAGHTDISPRYAIVHDHKTKVSFVYCIIANILSIHLPLFEHWDYSLIILIIPIPPRDLFNGTQWCSQPYNLVPLCKFQMIMIIYFFRNRCFHSQWTRKSLHSGLNRRAGYMLLMSPLIVVAYDLKHLYSRYRFI